MNGLPHWETPVINTYEWKISKSDMCVKDCDLKHCNRTWGHEGAKERGACMHCGDTDAALWARGIQPFASGKGRHDEVVLTVCNPRSDVFLTRLCFCFFIQIPKPAYQIHQFNGSRWSKTTINNLFTMAQYENDHALHFSTEHNMVWETQLNQIYSNVSM